MKMQIDSLKTTFKKCFFVQIQEWTNYQYNYQIKKIEQVV